MWFHLNENVLKMFQGFGRKDLRLPAAHHLFAGPGAGLQRGGLQVRGDGCAHSRGPHRHPIHIKRHHQRKEIRMDD